MRVARNRHVLRYGSDLICWPIDGSVWHQQFSIHRRMHRRLTRCILMLRCCMGNFRKRRGTAHTKIQWISFGFPCVGPGRERVENVKQIRVRRPNEENREFEGEENK